MKDLETLERAWRELPPAPRVGEVRAIVVRLGEGRHVHPEQVAISASEGVIGDRWAKGSRDPRAMVSAMEHRIARLVGGEAWAGVGDNLLVDLDLSEHHLPVGSRLQVGSAVLEISDKAHLGCKVFRARFGADALRWVNVKANRPRRLRGVHTRVVEGGVVRVGDAIRAL